MSSHNVSNGLLHKLLEDIHEEQKHLLKKIMKLQKLSLMFKHNQEVLKHNQDRLFGMVGFKAIIPNYDDTFEEFVPED